MANAETNMIDDKDTFRQKKIMAVSSSGGHWAQLLRLRPAFKNCSVVYVTTKNDLKTSVSGATFYAVMDSNRWNKLRLIATIIQVFFIVMWERPHVIISTGAAPGVFALIFGKLFGGKTIWLESLANAEMPSMSTRLVRRWADLWLTQWQHMAKPEGPFYMGSVL